MEDKRDSDEQRGLVETVLGWLGRPGRWEALAYRLVLVALVVAGAWRWLHS